MDKSVKRPKTVWLIFVLIVFGGVGAFFQAYLISTGNVELPPAVEQPPGILYYLQLFGFPLLAVAAATLMFLRFSVNRWIFSFLLVARAISILFAILSGGIPEQHFTIYIVGMLFSLCTYSLVTWYSFILLATGYYKDT